MELHTRLPAVDEEVLVHDEVLMVQTENSAQIVGLLPVVLISVNIWPRRLARRLVGGARRRIVCQQQT
jgi:hypothetical protein